MPESPPDFPQCVLAGLDEYLRAVPGGVAAYIEGEEIESLVKACDSRLFLVKGKSSWFQPGAQLSADRLGLLAAVAQGHEIIRVGDNGRGAGLSVTVLVVACSGGFFHSLHGDIEEQR